MRKAIATFKTNKSHGMDGITAEMMKAGVETSVSGCAVYATRSGTQASFLWTGKTVLWSVTPRKEI